MEECYLPVNLKRKDLEEVNDDFGDFSLSSPATKIRRLDAELPPIIKEEEMVNANPVVIGQPECSQAIDDLSSIPPVNEERAIVLYDPTTNAPLLQPRCPISVSVNPKFLSGFKIPVLWSNRSHILESINIIQERQEKGHEQNNGSLAVVPWVPMQSMVNEEASEMMDADSMEAVTMDIENDDRIQISEDGSVRGCDGSNQWQQHCIILEAPHNLSPPISWSGTGV